MLRRTLLKRAVLSNCTTLLKNNRRYATSISSFLPGAPSHVTIYEVGPRDGLQNEKKPIPVEVKVELINRLTDSGLRFIESGSFVAVPKIPQMAGTAEVMKAIKRKPGVHYPVLTPNIRGYEDAMKLGEADTIAIFTTASEAFCTKNINCTVKESLEKYKEVCLRAKKDNIKVRGYVSCVIGCPYEGPIDPLKSAEVARALYDYGCYEISMGDTIGVGTPGTTYAMLKETLKHIPKENIAVHFHDTYGQALSNVLVALQQGVTTVDSSVAGLGGCPYARGATGNLATEDLLYMLDGMGITTNVNLDSIVETGDWITKQLGRKAVTRAGVAMVAHKKADPTCDAHSYWSTPT